MLFRILQNVALSPLIVSVSTLLGQFSNGVQLISFLPNFLQMSSCVADEHSVFDIQSLVMHRRYTYLLLLLCACGQFAAATEWVIVSVIQPDVVDHFNLSFTSYSLLPSMVSLSALLGSFFAGYISDHLGRRIPFALGISVIAVCGLISVGAWHYWVLVLFRSLAAIGTGMVSTVDYILYVEFIHQSQRNSLVLFMFIGSPLAAAYIAGLNAIPMEGSTLLPKWRILQFLAIVPIIPAAILRWYFPFESPGYLLLRGRYHAAYELIKRLYNQNGDMPSLEEFTLQAQQQIHNDDTQGLNTRRHLLSAIWRVEFLTTALPLWFIYLTLFAVLWIILLYLPPYLAQVVTDTSRHIILFIILASSSLAVPLLALALKAGLSLTATLCLAFACSFISSLICTLAAAFAPMSFFLLVSYCTTLASIQASAFSLYLFAPMAFPIEIRGIGTGSCYAMASISGIFTPFLSSLLLEHTTPQQEWIMLSALAGLLFLLLCICIYLFHAFGKNPEQ